MQLETDVACSGAIRVRYGAADAAQHRNHHLSRIAPGSQELSCSVPRPGCSLQHLHSLNSTVTSVGMELSASPRSGNAQPTHATAGSAIIDSGSAPGSANSLQACTVSGTEASTASGQPAGHGLQRTGSGRAHSPACPPVPEPAEPAERSPAGSTAPSSTATLPPQTPHGMGMQRDAFNMRATFANMMRHVGGSSRSGSLHNTAPPGDGTGPLDGDSGGKLEPSGGASSSRTRRTKFSSVFRSSATKGKTGQAGAPAASNSTGGVVQSNTGSMLRKLRLRRQGASTAPMTLPGDPNAVQPLPRIKKSRGRRVTAGSTARPPLWRPKKLVNAVRRMGGSTAAVQPPPAAAADATLTVPVPPPAPLRRQSSGPFNVRLTPVSMQQAAAPAPPPPPRIDISHVYNTIASNSGHELPSGHPSAATPRAAPPTPRGSGTASSSRSGVATQLERIARGGAPDSSAMPGAAHSWPSDVAIRRADSSTSSSAHTVAVGGAHVNPNRGHRHNGLHTDGAPAAEPRSAHRRPATVRTAAPAAASTAQPSTARRPATVRTVAPSVARSSGHEAATRPSSAGGRAAHARSAAPQHSLERATSRSSRAGKLHQHASATPSARSTRSSSRPNTPATTPARTSTPSRSRPAAPAPVRQSRPQTERAQRASVPWRPTTPTPRTTTPAASSQPATPRRASRADSASARTRARPSDRGQAGPCTPAARVPSPAQTASVRLSPARSDAFAPPDSPRSRIPSSPRGSGLFQRSAPVVRADGTVAQSQLDPRSTCSYDEAELSQDDSALLRRMRGGDERKREQKAVAARIARSVALNNLPGMPKHLSARVWEDLEDPKFDYRGSRRKNEINNVLGAVLVNSRTASGHSGRIDGDDTSQSGSQMLDGSGAHSSGMPGSDDDGADDTAAYLNLELQLPARANCNFQRSDVIWKDAIAVGQGSSAIVFEAVARDSTGEHVNVVIKERRPRSDRKVDRAERRLFHDELELCAKLTHRNIVFCHGGYIAPLNAPFPASPVEPDFILFERCAASLSHYLACRYDEENPHQLWLREGIDVGLSILNALHWIHPNVTHGDLSSSNVLVNTRLNKEGINTMHVMLADFETARVKHRDVMRHGPARGTPAFMPPLDDEAALLRKGHDEDWIYQNRDVYSTSMIMLHAITGCCPFVSCVDHSQVNRLAHYNKNRYSSILPLPDGLPEQLEQFFRDCWAHKLGSAMLVRPYSPPNTVHITQARNRLLELKLSTPAALLDAPCVPSESLRRYQAAYPAVCNPPLDTIDIPPAAAAALARPHHDAHPSVFDDVPHADVFDMHAVHLPQQQRGAELARNVAMGSMAQRQEMLQISRGSPQVVRGDAVNACILHAPGSSDDGSARLATPHASRQLSRADSSSARRSGAGLLNGTPAAAAAAPQDALVLPGGGGIADIFKGICGAAGVDGGSRELAPPSEPQSRLPPTPGRRRTSVLRR